MSNLRSNQLKDRLFQYLGIVTTTIGLLFLAILLIAVFYLGVERLSWDFLTGSPSRFAERAGLLTPLVGSLWILILTAVFAVPIGIAAALYLEEYGAKTRFSRLIEINIANLAGVPSIIYGLLGITVFARWFTLGSSLLSGALTLALLILPIIIVAAREAIRAVPNSIREASFAMGATKWQTIWMQVLPASMGGIMTGVIIALSRAIGETAPLIVVGALAYVPFVPTTPMDEFSVLPIQIFNWTSRPQEAFLINAAAGIIILITATLLLNGIAIYLRNRWQRRIQW